MGSLGDLGQVPSRPQSPQRYNKQEELGEMECPGES